MWARPSWKHKVNTWLAKYVERFSVANAAAIVSVSSNYVDTLRKRYVDRMPVWLGAGRSAVIPFGVLPRDLEEASKPKRRDAHPREPAEIIYVGAGGPVMQRSFSLLCKALARIRVRNPGLLDQVRVALHGTMLGWHEGERRHLLEIAREYGLEDVVAEDPRRVSYRGSLELLMQSEGALILGVDDAGYMPSKLYSYALSGKPLLASLHRDGPAYAELDSNPILGRALWFDGSGEMPVDRAAEVVDAFVREVVARRSFDRRVALKTFLAPSMARRHVELFEACLGASDDCGRPVGFALARSA